METSMLAEKRGVENPETGSAALGRRLRTMRLRAGLSQKQLARSSTLSLRAIRDLENGRVRRPRADSLHLLAGALDLSAAQMNRLVNDYALGVPAGAAEPRTTGPFVGREQELAALTAMLRAEHHRLVTVTGLEGAGKTRLALEAAHRLEADDTTVLWLPLDDDRPTWLRDAVYSGARGGRLLAEAVGDRGGLLILDGVRPEDQVASGLGEILAACPGLRILVTTRDPDGLPPDTLFPLAPLPVPAPGADAASDAGELRAVPSVALLLAHLRRVQPGFHDDAGVLDDLAGICRALDGLPGAIEAAARWSLIYSVPQLARQFTAEPLTVARRLPGGHRRLDAFASVQRTVAALSSRQKALLAAMSRATWSIPELADQVGVAAAECADDVYHLLVLGILRRIDHRDVAMFQVLNLVGRTVQ